MVKVENDIVILTNFSLHWHMKIGYMCVMFRLPDFTTRKMSNRCYCCNIGRYLKNFLLD